MLPPERLDRTYVAFDDHRLVADAGLILPATLAHHLGVGSYPPTGPGEPGVAGPGLGGWRRTGR